LRALLGLSPGERLDHARWMASLHPDDRERLADDFARLLREGGFSEIEYRILRPDGTMRWLLSRAQVMPALERGVSLLGVTMDVTERKAEQERLCQSQRALAESEARLRLFIERAPAAIAMFDTEMRYLAASRRYLLTYGLPGTSHPEALIGQRHYDLFPWLPERWRDAHRRVLAGETLSVEADPFERPDGSSGWTRWEMVPWRHADGAIGGALLFMEDITTRIEAERALAASEARLRLALDAGRMGCWAWEAGSSHFTWDARQYELHGRDPAKGPPSWAEGTAQVYPEDLPRLEAATQAALASEDGIFQCEFRVVLPGGGLRWIGGYGRVLPGPDGRPARTAGLNFDVTARREAEAAAAASNEAARQAADRVQLALDAGAIIGTWVLDVPSGRFTADERFARSFGLDPDACRAGLSVEEAEACIHPEDWPHLKKAIPEAIAQGGTYHCEYRVRQPDGTYRWREAKGHVDLAPDGTPLRLPGVLIDIQERHTMEAERDRAMALLRTFVEAVPGMVYVKDREGRLLLANQGMSRIARMRPDELIGTIDTDWLPDGRQAAALMANDRRIMETGTAEQLEEEVTLPGGTTHLWLSTKAPLRNAVGEVIGLVGTSLDITERKKAEALVVRSKEELERLVEKRTRDLRETEARLAHAQRMEALGQLAGGIAHDFNNVLQAVLGGSTLIERRATQPDAVRPLARMVTDAARRGASITQRLLTFSRRGELRAEPLEPATLLDSMREILSFTLGAGVQVRVEAAAALPPLLADKGQLETVLVNLATNARDAMQGRGTLALTATAEQVPHGGGKSHPACLEAGSYIRLQASDTGRGMDAETLARASEPFFTTKGSGKGTGLGLAMARGFAEQSGGGLRIESNPGHGTTITLWLPVADPLAASLEHQEDLSPSATAERPRILLVDDEELVRAVLAQQLADQGYDVLQAGGSAAALAVMEAREPVDLLLSDLSMPGMDGIALIQEARCRKPGLPAILLTGYATDAAELVANGAAEGSFSLLRKPVTGSQLAHRISTMLRSEAPEPRRQ